MDTSGSIAPSQHAALVLHRRRERHRIFALWRMTARAPKCRFVDDRCSACRIGGQSRGRHLLRPFRPLRQCRVPEHRRADRPLRSRRGSKGSIASTRRIPDGVGFGSLPACQLRVRIGGIEDAFARRNRRRISCRNRTCGPRGHFEAAPRRTCRDIVRPVRARQFQVAAFAGVTVTLGIVSFSTLAGPGTP
jgi:hypothetical protein